MSIYSDVEHEDEVIHTVQTRFKQLAVTDRNQEDDLSDFGIDDSQGSVIPSSEDIIQASSTGTSEGELIISFFFLCLNTINCQSLYFLTGEVCLMYVFDLIGYFNIRLVKYLRWLFC